jgi:hypothetical protein
MLMQRNKLVFIVCIALILLPAGCVEGIDNHVDQPDGTASFATATTHPAIQGDPIVGTWQWTSRNDQSTVVYVINDDGRFTRHDYPVGADYRGNWVSDGSNKYTLTYSEPTPAELQDFMTYRPETDRLYRETGEFLDRTSS